ncbi:MAG: hypothetical protein CMO55_08840 [Verrucomicrobiales bacterium]|nr:hypothetical protein [Verrucomicrobiales bacterium]
MLKLYLLGEDTNFYWETWENKGIHTIHWGVLGTRGESKEIKSSFGSPAEKKIQAEIDLRIAEGYSQVEWEDHSILLIEYSVNGFGTPEDLEKRYQLQSRMDETLGWTGLGNCDGGSIGSGTMEVCCFVVDFDLAKEVIKEDLKGTEFEDYTRIYDESVEEG